ncbi:MAG: hypothetical protein COT16_00535 [Elusimicrobia bacterium CG08_land_8_20_14_0_20_44_26]|nr:MAG: hypothetical protein COT16_00535 [Elusimicrobia bacterium CG08_land_8_20_14_0_20_44_26]
MKFSLILTLLIFSSCARTFRYTDEEAGRVAAFFHIDENVVREVYAEKGLSWNDTIKKLILETISSQSQEMPEEFAGKIDDEVEKIKKACSLEP